MEMCQFRPPSSARNKVFSNLVDYRSFGPTKFIPRIPKAKFEAVVKASPNASISSPLRHPSEKKNSWYSHLSCNLSSRAKRIYLNRAP